MYNFTQDEFKQLHKLVDDIYNTSIVIDYFCSGHREIEELDNITPVVQFLRKNADILNNMFIDSKHLN
ncbi:MAG: hypothetical protein PHX18_08185 [Candidatus Gastranaerophilales bacterium]|nr:hypothetical protein [Candidatus Gastranaerophilales bacterium]